MLYKFNILFLLSYLNYKIMSINSLSSSSTVQHAINNSSMYVYKHFEFILFHFATLINALESLPLISPKSHQALILGKICILYKFYQLCWEFLPIMLELCSLLLLCFHNRPRHTVYLAWLQSNRRKSQWFQNLKMVFLKIPNATT